MAGVAKLFKGGRNCLVEVVASQFPEAKVLFSGEGVILWQCEGVSHFFEVGEESQSFWDGSIHEITAYVSVEAKTK